MNYRNHSWYFAWTYKATESSLVIPITSYDQGPSMLDKVAMFSLGWSRLNMILGLHPWRRFWQRKQATKYPILADYYSLAIIAGMLFYCISPCWSLSLLVIHYPLSTISDESSTVAGILLLYLSWGDPFPKNEPVENLGLASRQDWRYKDWQMSRQA